MSAPTSTAPSRSPEFPRSLDTEDVVLADIRVDEACAVKNAEPSSESRPHLLQLKCRQRPVTEYTVERRLCELGGEAARRVVRSRRHDGALERAGQHLGPHGVREDLVGAVRSWSTDCEDRVQAGRLGNARLANYKRFRQNSPLKPSESCLRPLALWLTLAPRRPKLTPPPRLDRFRNRPVT
jgi:hypothetical protein